MANIELSQESIERYQQLFNQTYLLIQLYRHNALDNPTQAQEYLGEHTMQFLRQALQGADGVYVNNYHPQTSSTEPEFENAQIAKIIFAQMHETVTSPLLPKGFARRGMLQAPQTPEAFRKRIRDVQKDLGLIVNGLGDPKTTQAAISSLRTRAFFHTGSILPIHVPSDVRRDQFNELLKGIRIDP